MRIKVMVASAVGLLAGLVVAFAAFPDAVSRFVTAPKTWSVGKAAVGGPFSLIDHNGRRVTEKTYPGEYLLVFFGFTHCPDICPAALQTVTAAMDQIGDKAKRLRPLFITVDPERDTAEILNDYVSNFHPRIVGLTGTKSEIAAVAKAYRAYYRKAEDDSITDGYSVDHSAFVYLMAPNGEYLTHFTHATPVEKMVTRLSAEL